MNDLYNFRSHTHCVYIYLGKSSVIVVVDSTIDNPDPVSSRNHCTGIECCITYDKQKTKPVGFGYNWEYRNNEDYLNIYDFMERLYSEIKEGKSRWNEIDKDLAFEIISFFSFIIKNQMNETATADTDDLSTYNYAIIVPSEWDEEVKENLTRSILIESGFISPEDHKDRVLFFSEMECICYDIQNHCSFERGQNTLLYRMIPVETSEVLVKLDLIQTTNTLFDFPGSKFRAKIKQSRSVSMSADDVQNSIKLFLENKLLSYDSCTIQDDDIQTIVEEIFHKELPFNDDCNENDWLMIPIITDTSMWKLNDAQTKIIKSIRVSDICREIGRTLFENMKDILSNSVRKIYKLIVLKDGYSNDGYFYHPLAKWIEYLSYYNRIFLNPTINLTRLKHTNSFLSYSILFAETSIIYGLKSYMAEIIRNSDMYCKPRIISNKNLLTSPSVFFNSKPNIIVSIVVSLKSTLLSYSLLDDNGLVKNIFDLSDESLPSLEQYYEFSNVKNLILKKQYVSITDKYLKENIGYLSQYKNDPAKKHIMSDIDIILNRDCSTKDVLVSNLGEKYNIIFLLSYISDTNSIISSKLPIHFKSSDTHTNIGYAFSIEKMVLDNTVGSKKDFQELIYMSGLVQKDNNFIKLRVTTIGEGFLPLIQTVCNAKFPLKSYFLLSQLHENHIQLSLNQVVTSSTQKDEQQESIISEDRIIYIQNIYDSFCLHMWNNIMHHNSLIQFCEMHSVTSDELYSLKIRKEFNENLKNYISNNILADGSDIKSTKKETILLNCSCNCHIRLTNNDIVEISLKPVLEDIASIVSTSLIDNMFFGYYHNVDYVFNLIHFNRNSQLQDTISIIMEEKVKTFHREQGIEADFLVISELLHQFLRPVLKQKLYLYKGFEIGTLHQVFSGNFALFFGANQEEANPLFKNDDSNIVRIVPLSNIPYPLCKKGDIISNVGFSKIFYPDYCDLMSHVEIKGYKSFNNSTKEFFLSSSDTKVDYSGGYYEGISILPLIVSINFVSYSSSIQFCSRIAGETIYSNNIIDVGEAMTLSRF